MTEVEKLLGKATFELAEQQANNQASNPDVAETVEEDTQRLIEEGYIDEQGDTAKVRRLAAKGVKFGEVCMDDVTPGDR